MCGVSTYTAENSEAPLPPTLLCQWLPYRLRDYISVSRCSLGSIRADLFKCSVAMDHLNDETCSDPWHWHWRTTKPQTEVDFDSTKITCTGSDHMTPTHMNRSVTESQQTWWLESCSNPNLTCWSSFKTPHKYKVLSTILYTIFFLFFFKSSSLLFCWNPDTFQPSDVTRCDQMDQNQCSGSFKSLTEWASSCNFLDNGTKRQVV